MPGPSNQAMNWSFVITSASQEVKDRERRRIVRANAMRYYWRRKKLASKDLPKTIGNHVDKDGGRPARLIQCLVEDDPDAATHGEQAELSRSAGTHHLLLEYQPNPSSRIKQTRNKDASPAAPHDGDNNAVGPTHMEDPARARRSNRTSLQKAFAPGPSERLGSGVTDPFDALPIGGAQHCYVLRNRKIIHIRFVLCVCACHNH